MPETPSGPPDGAPGEASGIPPGGERRRRRRSHHRTDEASRANPVTPGVVGAAANRVLAGVGAVLVLGAVLAVRWWIVAVIAAVIIVLALLWVARSRKRHPHPPWVRLSGAGGLIASVGILGPFFAVRFGAPQLHPDPQLLDRQVIMIPTDFHATLGEMRELAILFTAATLGVVLLAYSLSHRPRSERRSSDRRPHR